MIGVTAWALAAAVSQAAVPPPPERFFAECASPVYAVDHLICADTALSSQEGELARLWSLRSAGQASTPWIEDQNLWIGRRARCAFREGQRACVAGATTERLSVLDAKDTPPTTLTAICRSGAGTERLRLSITQTGIVGFAPSREAVFAALPATPDWTPFVRIVSSRRLEFRRLDGAILRCRPDPSSPQDFGVP